MVPFSLELEKDTSPLKNLLNNFMLYVPNPLPFPLVEKERVKICN
jgi:hypothetical protein